MHPEGPKKYFPVSCGRYWTKVKITAAVTQGPHVSALAQGAVDYAHQESQEKLAPGFAKVGRWDDIKHTPPYQT